MLLAIDIGNTTIAVGIFRDRVLVKDWRLETDPDRTVDEYSVLLLSLFRISGVDPQAVDGVILSSVVPPLTPVFQDVVQAAFGRKTLVVGPGLRTGMPILYEIPHEVGADRVVAAVAAFERLGGPCIVVDFGTATTFDAVTAAGEYLGGAIAPGVRISAEALYLKTARLPRIEIRKPRRAVGRTTVASMQSGLYFGYVGLVQNIIRQMIKEFEVERVRVIATGGFGADISAEVPEIEMYEPNLVLEGLRIIFDRNRGLVSAA